MQVLCQVWGMGHCRPETFLFLHCSEMKLALWQLGPQCQGSPRCCLNGTHWEEINASTQLRHVAFISQCQDNRRFIPSHLAISSKKVHGKETFFFLVAFQLQFSNPPAHPLWVSITLFLKKKTQHYRKNITLKWKTGLAENGWQMPAVTKIKGRLQSWMCFISERLREEKKAALRSAPDLPAIEIFTLLHNEATRIVSLGYCCLRAGLKNNKKKNPRTWKLCFYSKSRDGVSALQHLSGLRIRYVFSSTGNINILVYLG